MSSMPIISSLDIVKYMDNNNGKIVINISTDAVGHVLAEFENFARMRLTGEIDPDGVYLYLGEKKEYITTIADLYGGSLCQHYILSSLAPEMARNIALFRPDLVVDAGFSSTKIAPIGGKTLGGDRVQVDQTGRHFVYRTPVEWLLADGLAYYHRRLSTFSVLPMARQFNMDQDLERYINAQGKPLALIHIKDHETSATAEASDPATYLPTLEFLRDKGYHLVQVGREHHPESFANLGVVNYANSQLASFKNDFVLFSNCGLALTGPSGIGIFAELMGKPYIYTNSWHLIWPPFAPSAVYVPALAVSRNSGEPIRFIEQLNFFRTSGVHFPHDKYEVMKADKDDILAATIEALDLENNLIPINENQKNFRMLDPNSCNLFSLSRISAAFIERYKYLM